MVKVTQKLDNSEGVNATLENNLKDAEVRVSDPDPAVWCPAPAAQLGAPAGRSQTGGTLRVGRERN